MRTTEEVNEVCKLCIHRGSAFQANVARTVLYTQGGSWSRKQESIVCAGASYRASSNSNRQYKSYFGTDENYDPMDFDLSLCGQD